MIDLIVIKSLLRPAGREWLHSSRQSFRPDTSDTSVVLAPRSHPTQGNYSVARGRPEGCIGVLAVCCTGVLLMKNLRVGLLLLQRVLSKGHHNSLQGMMLLAKSKMADILVTICPPHAFRLPKAPRLAHGYEAAVEQVCACVSTHMLVCRAMRLVAAL